MKSRCEYANQFKQRKCKIYKLHRQISNLCCGDLTLEIDGEKVIFGSMYCSRMSERKGICPIFWHSGGYIRNYEAYTGEWQIDVDKIPEKYRKYASEIDEVFNANVPYGCCGGCE